MKKFNALLFAMALMAVVAFASVASAASFVAVDKAGNIELLTVQSDGTYQNLGNTMKAPKLDNNNVDLIKANVRVFAYDDGITVVSSDMVKDNAKDAKVVILKKSTTDDSYSYYKTIDTKGLGTVRSVHTLDGSPVFHSDGAADASRPSGNTTLGMFAYISDDKFVSKDISVDTMFVYGSELFVINSHDSTKSYIHQITLSDLSKTSKDLEEKVVFSMLGTPIPPEKDTDGAYQSGAESSKFPTIIFQNAAYVSNGRHLYAFDITEKTKIMTAPNVAQVIDGNYLAMYPGDDMVVAIKSKDNAVRLVSLVYTETANNVTERTILTNISSDIHALPNGSFDIYYSTSDKVMSIVNHGQAVAFYVPDSNNNWKFLTSTDEFVSAAMVKTASTTPDTPDTPVTPTPAAQVVDVANSSIQSAILSAFPNTTASSFLTSDKVTLGDADAISDAAKEALEAKVADGYHVKSYNLLKKVTLTEKGYILLEGTDIQKLDSSKHVVLAFNASGTSYPVKLLNASGTVLAETVTYLGAGELPAGDYNIYYAETEKDSDDSGDTGSSSSGCNAGFAAISALLALAFIKKSR